MSKRSRNWTGIILALMGLAVFVVVLYFHYAHGVPIGPVPVGGAIVLFFVGGAIIDVAAAEEIGGFVVKGAVTIIGALPFGRRATDKIAASGETVIIPPTQPPPTDQKEGE